MPAADTAEPETCEGLAGVFRCRGTGADPSVATMRAALDQVAAVRGGHDLPAVRESLAMTACDAEGLHPTLDYMAAAAYRLIGFETRAFTPIAAMARLAGWAAHIAEQLTIDGFACPCGACRPRRTTRRSQEQRWPQWCPFTTARGATEHLREVGEAKVAPCGADAARPVPAGGMLAGV